MSEGNAHLFVCFSSKDHAIARSVVEFLEKHGLACWISLRDVPPGANYQESIVQAIEHAMGIIFLFSESSSQSGEIKKELSIGGSINVPVFPLRLSPITPSGALRYELATRQWIDLFPDHDQALRKLVETIQKVLQNPRPLAATAASGPNDNLSVGNVATLSGAPAKTESLPVALLARDSPEFEAVRSLLAKHVGPIAKVLVQKASTETRSFDEFLERLGMNVPTPTDRTAFLTAARARLAVKP